MIGRMVAWLQAAGAAEQAEEGVDIGEIMMHHLADSHEIELPWGVWHLPRFEPVHLGPLTIDFSPTKHVVFLFVAAILVALLLITSARKAARAHREGAERGPKGVTNVVEAFILFLRDEVALSNIGHGGERYVPFIITLFFFVLFANLLGLFPWGSTPTGNLAVTAALATLSLITIEVAGFLQLGARGYAKTIFFAPKGMGPVGTAIMLLIMTPVEVMGKLAKPFALAIRLFANMTAGHSVVLALVGLIMLALPAVIVIVPAPLVMAVLIMILEIFVALLQAYIFAMLTAVFIGLIRHAH
ncbi:MAG TPA: F0F1 ATP synthase subunit A [Longimicrobiales bacterium]